MDSKILCISQGCYEGQRKGFSIRLKALRCPVSTRLGELLIFMDFGSGLKNFVTCLQRADNLIGEKVMKTGKG